MLEMLGSMAAVFIFVVLLTFSIRLILDALMPAPVQKKMDRVVMHHLTEADPLPQIMPYRRIGEGNWELIHKHPWGMYARQEHISVVGLSIDDGIVVIPGSYRTYGDDRPGKPEQRYPFGL